LLHPFQKGNFSMQFRLANTAIAGATLCAMMAVPAQSATPMSAAPMSVATIGVGAHGYDFLAGTWTCKNSTPSAMSGPATTTVNIARTTGGSLMFHASGANFAGMGYVAYNAKTKMWSNPAAYSDGGYGNETSVGTGKKNVWTGPITDASGKTMQQRDTYMWTSSNSYTDLYQVEMGGSWKTEGNSVCTRG
jgi:hypothetical protein